MERSVEILSPVGDLETFYTAVRSGANAVYLGLPKFNARIKAENISLDNISDVVKYAHLHDVRVYLTLNTLVTTSEMKEVVEMVDVCVNAGVDAYIVQDLGIIHVLKTIYPDIVLHGSTQMGIHNVRGARVAKALGLSRIVLSRETTLQDIEAIKREVDIEIEVFVQGAMCVAFSGNCYMSAIKCGASGNRGECKQLCRLPYTLSNGRDTLNGYIISMRDNSMMSRLGELVELGVDSLKIEGRLKRPGYVGQMTSIYAGAVDDILLHKAIDVDALENKMSKVFARGKYIAGYNDGNDVIEPSINNHIGECIGRVVKCNRFKEIYQIHIATTKNIHAGDGIKFLSGHDVLDSIGVGNVDKCDNNIVVYGTKYIPDGTSVYLAIDNETEKSIVDTTRKYPLHISFYAHPNEPICVEASFNGDSHSYTYDECAPALKLSIDYSAITTAIERANKGTFDVTLDVDTDGAFIPLSRLNGICRDLIANTTEDILSKYNVCKKIGVMPDRSEVHSRYDSLAIVSDEKDIKNLSKKFDALIFSPSVYSVAIIEKFYSSYKEYFDTPMYLNLPMIALLDDMGIIDDIVASMKGKDVVLVAENLYALDYLADGYSVMAGSNLNITNDYSVKLLSDYGVSEIVSSIEKWCPTIAGSYKVVSGNNVLMTFAHCPNKTLYGNTCEKCTHIGGLTLSDSKSKYTIRRVRVKNCYFELVDSISQNSKYHHEIHDLRGGNYV